MGKVAHSAGRFWISEPGSNLLRNLILEHLARVVVRRLAAEEPKSGRWRDPDQEDGCD
jgi:hypothetical protein